jgi:hypothetical protein
MTSRQQAVNKMKIKQYRRKMKKKREEVKKPLLSDDGTLRVTNAKDPKYVYRTIFYDVHFDHRKGIVDSIVCPICNKINEKEKDKIAKWDNKWKAFKCNSCETIWEHLDKLEMRCPKEKIELPKTSIKQTKKKERNTEFFEQDFYKHRKNRFYCPKEDCKRHKKPFKTYEQFYNHYIDKHLPPLVRKRMKSRQKEIRKKHWTTFSQGNKYRKRKEFVDYGGKIIEMPVFKHPHTGKKVTICSWDGCMETFEVKDGKVDKERMEAHLKEHRKEHPKLLKEKNRKYWEEYYKSKGIEGKDLRKAIKRAMEYKKGKKKAVFLQPKR